jgi:hypothetical protein
MGRVKNRFLRAVVETVQQQTGGGALARLRGGLTPYLLRMLSREVLGPPERDATIDLEAGIELLLAIDRVLCGGSGVVTARATSALASRVLSQSSGLVVAGDAVATLQHLRAPFEQPFVDVDLRFHVRRLPDGFVLELHLAGRPQATRWLSSAGLGYAKAATTFSGSGSPRLRFDTELSGDLARVMGRHAPTSLISVPAAPQQAQRDERLRLSAPRRRSSPTNAAAQVDEILNRVSAALPSPPNPGVARVRSAAYTPPGEAEQARAQPPSGVRPAERGALAPRSRKSAI